MFLTSRRCLFSMAAIFVMCAVNLPAAELTITNHSFENPVLSDGGGTSVVPGWVGEGVVQIYNPENSFFLNTTDGWPSPLDGFNAVGINIGGKLSYQTTNLVAPDTIYFLSFITGRRFGANVYGSSSASLWAGTNLLAARFPNPVEGTFVSDSLSYTSPSSGPVIGLPLRIELLASGPSSQPWFDNFHLSATPSVCTPHKATASARLVNGVFVGATIIDPGCGYTNTPIVSVEGGGGFGAAATAVVTNGQVVEIRVTNGGCCYTNLPQIIIQSPPFVPTVDIRVSRVAVGQNVELGHKYVLESSDDLQNWTPTGPSFTTTSERVESEFSVTNTGRYFRLREVP